MASFHHSSTSYALQQLHEGSSSSSRQSATDVHDDFLDQYVDFDGTDYLSSTNTTLTPQSSSTFLPRSTMSAPSDASLTDVSDQTLQFYASQQLQPTDERQPQQQLLHQQQTWASFPPPHSPLTSRPSRGRRQTFAEHCSTRATISDSDLLSLEGIHLKSPRYPPSPPPGPHPSPASAKSTPTTTILSAAPSLRRKKGFSRSTSSYRPTESSHNTNASDQILRTPSRNVSRSAVRKSVSPAKMQLQPQPQLQPAAELEELTQRLAADEAAAFEFDFKTANMPITPPPSARISDTGSASERYDEGHRGSATKRGSVPHGQSLSFEMLAGQGGSFPWVRPIPQFNVVRNGKQLHTPVTAPELGFSDPMAQEYALGWPESVQGLTTQQPSHFTLPEYAVEDGDTSTHPRWDHESQGNDIDSSASNSRQFRDVLGQGHANSLSTQLPPATPWPSCEDLNLNMDLDLPSSLPMGTDNTMMQTSSPSQLQQSYQDQLQQQQQQHNHLRQLQRRQQQQLQQRQQQYNPQSYIPTTPLRRQRSGYSTTAPPPPLPAHYVPSPSPHLPTPPRHQRPRPVPSPIATQEAQQSLHAALSTPNFSTKSIYQTGKQMSRKHSAPSIVSRPRTPIPGARPKSAGGVRPKSAGGRRKSLSGARMSSTNSLYSSAQSSNAAATSSSNSSKGPHTATDAGNGNTKSATDSTTIQFHNFTPLDGSAILSGVAPSGSSKTKARREREAAERLRQFGRAAMMAVEKAGGDVREIIVNGGEEFIVGNEDLDVDVDLDVGVDVGSGGGGRMKSRYIDGGF